MNSAVQVAVNTSQNNHNIIDSERERNLLNTNNVGAFYKFINNKLHNSSGIAPLYNDAGTLLTSDLGKANLLNSYFKSVFIQDDGIVRDFNCEYNSGRGRATY